MSDTAPMSECEQFDLKAEVLALGMVDEPMRGQLLAHAANCPTCQLLLDGLGTVIDRLLLVAPQEEPPAGFESRALDRIGPPSAKALHRFRLPLWAAGFVAVIVGATSFLVVRQLKESPSPAAAPAVVIVTPAGLRLGTVQLVANPAPHVLVMIAAPRPEPGVRNCELQLSDGTWVKVGSWQVADIAHGVWAVGVDAALLRATAMRITNVDGKVLATATFI